jgi:hypothetical protein
MSRRLLLSASALVLYVLGTLLTGCSSSNSNNQNHNQNHNPASITVTSGSSQSATVSTAFSSPLVATVADSGGNPVSGVSVTFTVVAGSGGASASFTTGGATDTETTGSNGQASTSQTLTANATTGTFTVTANFTGNTGSPATFNLTNTAVVVSSATYVFYASGTEMPNANNGNAEAYYAVAGALSINASGSVVAGEEDYNDSSGITEGGASGAVSITSGSLSVDATTGQGTLTLVTNNALVGGGVNPAGTETFGVQFVNANHAIIMQFDESATSSGSLDLQTTTPASSANFAFTLAGVDSGYNAVGYGGVFSVSGGSGSGSGGAMSGIADVNDDGTVTTGNPFTGATVGNPDSLLRGQVSGLSINGTTLALTYYVVGPETIRLIDMDAGKQSGAGAAAIGSAYGQGASIYTASSLSNSVIGLNGTLSAAPFGTAGSLVFTPTSGTSGGTFTGTMDDDEEAVVVTDQAISGDYSMSNVVSGITYNGYGALSISSSPFFYLTNMGVYMTDPALNLVDPNNTTGGGGGLVLDLDSNLSGGTGIVVPQTDLSSADLSGNYAFGAQEAFPSGEYDYLGQGTVSSLALTGTGLVSDPIPAPDSYFGPNPELYTNVSMTGTATPDANEATNGRYTINPFFVNAYPSSPFDNLSLGIYQASAGLLLFMEDSNSVGSGSFQQQGSLTGLPAKKSPVKRSNSR